MADYSFQVEVNKPNYYSTTTGLINAKYLENIIEIRMYGNLNVTTANLNC